MKTTETLPTLAEQGAQIDEYNAASHARAAAVLTNASRRARGLAPLPVPAKPEPPRVPHVYDLAANWAGRGHAGAEVPEGWRIKWFPFNCTPAGVA